METNLKEDNLQMNLVLTPEEQEETLQALVLRRQAQQERERAFNRIKNRLNGQTTVVLANEQMKLQYVSPHEATRLDPGKVRNILTPEQLAGCQKVTHCGPAVRVRKIRYPETPVTRQ